MGEHEKRMQDLANQMVCESPWKPAGFRGVGKLRFPTSQSFALQRSAKRKPFIGAVFARAIKRGASGIIERMLSKGTENKGVLCIRNRPVFLGGVAPVLGVIALSLLLFAPFASAIPEVFTVQGRLTDSSGNALSGDFDLGFYLYDSNSAGRNLLWSEVRLVTVGNGVFSVVIGDANTQRFLNTLDFNSEKWLGIDVNGEMQSPLIRFSSIGSAFTSKKAFSIDLNAFQNFADFNKWYESVFDLNNHYYQRYDVNTNFVPYTGATKDVNLGSNMLIVRDLNVFRDANIFRDVNVGGSVKATAFFGSGAGLTGITSMADINAQFVPYISATKDINIGIYRLTAQDLNAMAIGVVNNAYILGKLYAGSDINSGGSIQATAFYGSGAGLTGIASMTDINAQFVPYVAATKDMNIGIYGIMAFGDSNFNAFYANAYFGDGSGLTGVVKPADLNAQWVPYIGAAKDVNLGSNMLIVRDLNVYRDANIAGDLNVRSDVNVMGSVQATAFYGSGAGLTGIASMGDINANFVPYVAAAKDVNLGNNLFAARDVNVFRDANIGRDLNVARNQGIAGDLYVAGTVRGASPLKVGTDLNVSQGASKGVSISSDANRICFPSDSCEAHIDYNGTALVFSAG